MINPAEIIDSLIEKLRAIPELVELMGGDEERIFAYHDRYPKKSSIETATSLAPAPSIMVAWAGTGPSQFGGNEAWRHEFSLALRTAPELDDGQTPASFYQLFRLITKGIPQGGDGVPLIFTTVHGSCHPMETPLIRRLTDIAGINYFEVLMSFTEIGDD